jgi:hypothetical protein
MSISTAKRALGAALTTLAFFGATSLARADINDYEFQLIQKEIKKGDAILSVRLVHKPDGKVVPDAVIFATRWPRCRQRSPRLLAQSLAFIVSRSI